MPWSPTLSLLVFSIGAFAQQGISLDSATTTHEPLVVRPISTASPGVVVYSYSTPTPYLNPTSAFSDFVPSSTDSPPFMPPPPHIWPTWSIPGYTHPTSANSGAGSINAGAIAGAVIGGFALVIAAVVAIFYCRKRKGSSRKGSARGSWQDLEGKGASASSNNASPCPHPPDDAKVPESGVQDPYTKYIPRKEGSSNSVFPTVSRIMRHHSSSDPFADPQPPRGHYTPYSLRNGSPNTIEMKINPSSP